MTNREVVIIVLNWNGAADTIDCVDSLLNQSIKSDIIIIDNGSTDDSTDMLNAYISKTNSNSIFFIKNRQNTGFAGGINTGLKYALNQNYKYIGTLNPDATADNNWISSIKDVLVNSPEVGIATGILARSDKIHIDSTGEQYSIWGIPNPRGRGGLIKNAPDKPEYIFAATGGGFIAKREVYEAIGQFDEKFFMYFEDVDLCFRAQLAGYKVVYTPKAIAYHKLSVSTNKVPGLAVFNTFKNLPMLFIKNMPLKLWIKVLPRFSLAYVLILGKAILSRKCFYALRGLFMSVMLMPYAFISRRVIQKNRRVTVLYINSILLHKVPDEQIGLKKMIRIFTTSDNI